MAATDLLTLPDARKALRLAGTDTSSDSDLTAVYLSATTAPVEDIIGPVVIRAFTEWRDGGAPMIALDQRPVVTVTSASESYGNFTRTLTSQPLDGSGFDAYGYTFDPDTGVLYRRAVGGSIGFAAGRQNVKVVYTAGRVADTASVATSLPSVLLAARMILRQMWQADQQGTNAGRQINGVAPDETLVRTPSGFLVPQRAFELLHPLAKSAGVS